MPYYNDALGWFWVDGVRMLLTEEQAEGYDTRGSDVVAERTPVPIPVPDKETDDLLAECTCLPDLPDGRVNGGRGHVCASCQAYFDSLLDDDEW
jgi:hypothetical protein